MNELYQKIRSLQDSLESSKQKLELKIEESHKLEKVKSQEDEELLRSEVSLLEHINELTQYNEALTENDEKTRKLLTHLRRQNRSLSIQLQQQNALPLIDQKLPPQPQPDDPNKPDVMTPSNLTF